MTYDNDKRRRLLSRLSRLGRGLAGTVPILALAAGGVSLVGDRGHPGSTRGGLVPHQCPCRGWHRGPGRRPGRSASRGGRGEAEGEAEGAGAQAVRRPEGFAPAYSESGANPAELLARGETLYYDSSLSGNGLACASCHGSDGNDIGYQATFEQPFPHAVAMARERFGMDQVHADEMVQICMVAPMEAEPLAWGSEELTSLAAYMVEVQRRFAGESHDL